VNTNDFDSYDGTDKLQSEFHLRFITKDKWSRHSTNPVEQAFTVTINYQCQDDYFRYKTGATSIGQQDYALKITSTAAINTLSLDWTPVVEQVVTPCPYTHPTYVFNNNTRVWDPIASASPLSTDFDIVDTTTNYFLSFKEKATLGSVLTNYAKY